MTRPAKPTPRGFTLLEVMLSMVVMTVLLVAVVNTLGATARGQQVRHDRTRAMLLAQDLMEEIVGLAYEEPFELVLFGPEASETGGTRANFDDVDDYHGWNSGTTPMRPRCRDGSLKPGLTNWARTVNVEFVSPANITSATVSDQGIKRITVTVSKDGVVRCTLVMIRTAAWMAPPYD